MDGLSGRLERYPKKLLFGINASHKHQALTLHGRSALNVETYEFHT